MVLVLEFLCCWMVFRILRILAEISQLVMMSGQKLQVKHMSKRTQELSPRSAPNKLAIQALLQGLPVVPEAGLGWDVLH